MATSTTPTDNRAFQDIRNIRIVTALKVKRY